MTEGVKLQSVKIRKDGKLKAKIPFKCKKTGISFVLTAVYPAHEDGGFKEISLSAKNTLEAGKTAILDLFRAE
ncbi:hypothetical protein ACLEIY_10335 [Acetobacter tropicalis]|uniref:hypothetical protein n=1 Tax=Acetobacter TaxID=434 RepID=UPI00073F6E7C|nr:hypothetical protein [Acetobacter senegalensis]